MQQIYNITIYKLVIKCFFCFFCIFSFLPALVFSQNGNTRITLHKKNISVIEALKEVEQQTDLSIGYNESQLKTKIIDELTLEKETLENSLGKILENTGYTYQIEGKYVIIAPAKKQSKDSVPKQIIGKVKDPKGEPLIGVSILVKGTDEGTITDMDGNYKIETHSNNPVLVFSYIGYKTQEIPLKGQSSINVTLMDDTQIIDEVVVTALGIKRAEKALSYNVQQVNTEAIAANKDANFINALNGKVAGVNINSSSSGVGGVSKVTMRGTKSIMQSSNALYVIDGVPMFSGRSSKGGTEMDSQGASEPIADINPDDIESMSVLTGAAAAALYGSDAANGAVVITTKKGKEGKLSITVNSNTEFSNPLVMPRFQNRYGTGVNGVMSENGARSWGALLLPENNYNYNPKDDYFQTGIIGTESISLSTGTDKNQTYASAAAVNSKGIIPNNKYNRYNFTVRNTTTFLDDKMTFDIGASYVLQNDQNMTNQGIYSNPLVGAYLFPRGYDWAEYKMFERYDSSRDIYMQYWPVGDEGMTMQNPYWINYRNLRMNKKDRYMLNASLNYQILDWLSISGRVRLDNSNNDYTENFYASTNTQLTELSTRGLHGITRTNEKQLYADFLVSVNRHFNDIWSLQANLGGSFSDMRSDAIIIRGPIADGGEAFKNEPVGLTNFFAIQNLSNSSRTKRMRDSWREQTQSIFASAEIGYRSTYYLTLTGRNDWPSQLAGPNSNSTSFFYPSVGASIVLSELMPNLNKDYLSYMKVRGSWASVGTAFQRYLANPRYTWDDKNKSWSVLSQYPLYNLKPERTQSFEVGISMKFFKNFDLDVTYYNAKTMNQTFNPQLAVSGWSAMYIQTGAVRNSGIELSLGYKNTWKNFTWDTGITFSTNKNKILELADNAINPITGEKFSKDQLDMGGLGEARFLLKEGGSMGDLYSTIDLQRDSNGDIYIDAEGKLKTENIKDVNSYIKLGSVLPKGNLSWRNNFTWKNFNASFLLSARLGGIVYSSTQGILDSYGVSEVSADARDNGYIKVNSGDYVSPEIWYTTIGAGTAVPQYYTYSATNVRLQEASIGYTIPRKWLHGVCDIKVALVGRNLWMIYNKAPFDPESVASTDNFYQGIDYFMMPALRNIGFNVSFKF